MLAVTPQVQVEVDAGRIPIQLVRFDFAGVPPVLLTTAAHDIEWGGDTWLSNGFLLGIDAYSLASELRTSSGQIGLTGVDLSISAILLNTSQTNRKITIYDAFLNPVSGAVIPDPYIRDIAFIDDYAIDQGTTEATVLLALSGEWADFEIKRGIRTTDASLRAVSGDTDRLFRYSKAVNKEIRWGGK